MDNQADDQIAPESGILSNIDHLILFSNIF